MSPRGLVLVAMAAALAASACYKTEPPQDIDVGVQRVTARVPNNWEVLAERSTVRIKAPPPSTAQLREFDRSGVMPGKFDGEVRLRDMGPVTPEGLHREVSALRKQWQEGLGAQVQQRMKALTPVGLLLRVPFALRDFHNAWAKLRTVPVNAPYDEVAAHFDTILGTLAQTLSLDLPVITDWALPYIEPRNRREIAWRKPKTVDKREGEELETWDQLAHNGPRRVLFVVNDGYLLVVASGHYDRDDSLHAYDAVVSSLEFTRTESMR